MTGERVYKEVPLSALLPNPWNPRKSFEGQKFNDLVESIRAKGVLEPILVRPVTDLAKKKDKDRKEFQIVAGERRWRASCEIAKANGGMKKATIPAIVQDMTDDDAFDVMTIENLQRDDLTELEEAESFRAWVERRRKKDKKADAVKDLADRTGIGQRYIRRRIQIMTLPEKVLKAWEQGKISFGHCEQLLRLGDEKKVDEYFGRARSWDGYSVARMRKEIDELSIELQHAAFDLEKAGCNSCESNTEVQKQLFGDELAASKTACLNPKCFKKNQNEGLLANWEKKFKKRYGGTNGFRFYEGYGNPKHQAFGKDHYGCKQKEPAEKCADCKDFVTVLEISGKVHCKQACLNEKCYTLLKAKKETRVEKERIGGASTLPNEPAGPEAPRVSWHGQHFREEFFKEILPSWISNLDVDSDQCLRIVLTGILNSNINALEYFRKMALATAVPYRSGRHSFEPADWKFIEGMDCVALRTALKALGGYITMQTDKTSHETRCAIASHLGIDLARDWRITQSYLDKKTKAEILALGEQLGIFADPKAETYLKEKLCKRKFSALKKAELDRVILESGVDLTGKVPAEILDVKGDRQDDDEDGCMDYVNCPHFDECEHIAQKCKHQWEEDDRPPCCFECDDLEGCDQRCQLYGIRTCRECGCTDEYGCDGGCSWVEDDLCSACQGKENEE